ncbi:MAG TPA: hydroxyacid dehydrogenase [Tepidisphaeraceae bacterium]|nr:hydroxyacid dehydrogenase [Tepidisphaeraceae bacterium]
MRRLNGLYILDSDALELTYGPAERRDIERYVDFVAPAQTRATIAADRSLLKHVEVIFSGWGAPLLDDVFLDAAPNLKAFFHAAGSVGYCVTDEMWERGVMVTTANAANAVPVAEYTLGTILFSLKHGWKLMRQTREQRTFVERDGAPGAYGSTIGLISLGAMGRAVLARLAPFDFNVIVHDPYIDAAEAKALGVELVSLAELFKRADVVSLHSPSLAETQGMITGAHLASMKPGATFINTSRGEIVREDELLAVAAERADLQFVLDVVATEPPPVDSPLYTLANIVLTPHIAGSVGNECRRMGRYMVQELERFVAGKPLKWLVTPESSRNTTHRPVTVKTFAKGSKAPRHSAPPLQSV